jgi:hypothetical protein
LESMDERTLTRREGLDPDADFLEPSYKESVRRYNARRTAFHREKWISFYRRMEQLHRTLAAEHQRKADALMRDESPNDG